MKTLFLIALLMVCRIGQAQANDSSNYDILQSTVDQRALAAKFGVALYASAVFSQVAQNIASKTPVNDSKVCFRLGSFLVATLESTARYELYAVDAEQRAKGQEASRLAFRAGTFCGFTTDDISTPAYLLAITGLKSTDEIGVITSIDELRATILRIVDLTSVK